MFRIALVLICCALVMHSCKNDNQKKLLAYFSIPENSDATSSFIDSMSTYNNLLDRSNKLYLNDSIANSFIVLDEALQMIPTPKDQWIEFIHINKLKAGYLLYDEPETSQKIYNNLLSNYKSLLPDSLITDIYQNLSQVCLVQFRIEQAHSYLDTAIIFVANDLSRLSEIWTIRGNIFYAEHKLDATIAQYKKAIPHLPKDQLYLAHQNLCLFLANDEKYEDAKKYLKYLFTNQSSTSDLFYYYKLSGINEKLDSNYLEAIHHLNAADSIAVNTNSVNRLAHSDILSELGHCKVLIDKAEEAITIFDKALELTADYKSYEYYNAILYKLKAYRTLAESNYSDKWLDKGLNLADYIYSFLESLKEDYEEKDLLDVLTYFHDMYDDWLYLASQIEVSNSKFNKDLLLFKIFKRRKDHLNQYTSIDYANDLSLLKEKAKTHKATFVNYFLGHINTFVLVINKENLYFKTLENPNSLGSLIKSIDYAKENKVVFSQLYKELILPIQDLLSETIVIIPDNEISNIAFKHLVDSNGKTLLSKFDLAYSNSLSRCLTADLNKHLDLNSIDICAFAYSSNSTLSRSNTSELPSSLREVDYFKSFPKSKLFYGSDATKNNLFDDSKNATLLHLALHGYSDVEDINKNYLVFRNSNAKPDTLFANEITGFNNELLVLSSCLSSSGIENPVNGTYNLVKSFQKSNVEYIVSNLSVVEDKSMPAFMKEFYTNIQKNNSVIKSFNAAQRQKFETKSNTIRINI